MPDKTNPLTLDDIAPYPATIDEATADRLARHLTVEAYADHAATAILYEQANKAIGTPAERSALGHYQATVNLMLAEWALSFLLRQIIRHAPRIADEMAQTIRENWDHGLGDILRQVLTEYGIDPNQVTQAALLAEQDEKAGVLHSV